jgi:hypothetical protein
MALRLIALVPRIDRRDKTPPIAPTAQDAPLDNLKSETGAFCVEALTNSPSAIACGTISGGAASYDSIANAELTSGHEALKYLEVAVRSIMPALLPCMKKGCRQRGRALRQG